MSSSILTRRHTLASQPQVQSVLTRLHAQSLAQEESVGARGVLFPKSTAVPAETKFEEQLVALDEDKCATIYSVLRATGATRVVEGRFITILIWASADYNA